MFEAATKALAQMGSPVFRRVLLKSAGLALLLLVLLGVGLYQLGKWFLASGSGWLERVWGPGWQGTINTAESVLALIVGLGLVVGAVFLMPAATALVAGVFSDEIAAEVERTHYPQDPPGHPIASGRALFEGIKTALLAVLVYLSALPLLLFAGVGAVVFFVLTAFLLGREYFELAAMRFRTPLEAKALRKQHGGTVFAAGLLMAGLVSIPIINLATPLFGIALMVHLHKRLTLPLGREQRQRLT